MHPYTYGVTKGTTGGTSKIAANHLLSKVQYPDSTDATNDIVAFAYNAQGEEIWRRDQALTTPTTEYDNYNIVETDYDLAGRVTARRVTKKRDITDGAVLRIGTAYDNLGRVDTVTQYNAASGGAAVDEVKYLYDGWGNVTNFRQDINSVVSGSGYWEVAYAYEKATGGRNTLRRTEVTLPGGEAFKYFYRSGTGSHDDKASRVTLVRDKDDSDLAGYLYNGTGHVVRTEMSEVGIYSKAYNGSGTTFGRLDRFNRTLISSWTRDLSPTNRDIYNVTLGYDRNSNVISQDDAVHTGHDVAYVNDGLNRLTDADEGTLSGGAIDALTRKRRQQWTLTQTGNWSRDKVDMNGDGDFLDAGELDDTRTHNAVNELLTRDTNTADFSLTYDAAGNMTDDGVYKYEWDAFYRLRKVKNQSNALVSEYWYNGLGYLVTRHQDTDVDGDVDGSDQKFHTAYDERWRQVATYRGSDVNPKERFLYHWAGDDGYGGSSYIDAVVLRDRDMTNGWTGAADGTLEERVYYLQNWRADVVGLVEPDGSGGATMVEWVKYSAYGVPFALPAGDTDSDGDCDSTDDAQVTTWKNAPFYDVRGDLDLDGVVDAADETLVGSAHQSLGRGVLSSTSIGSRKGWAGLEGDARSATQWCMRLHVLDSTLGRRLNPMVADSISTPLLFDSAARLASLTKSSSATRSVPASMMWLGKGDPGSGGPGQDQDEDLTSCRGCAVWFKRHPQQSKLVSGCKIELQSFGGNEIETANGECESQGEQFDIGSGEDCPGSCEMSVAVLVYSPYCPYQARIVKSTPQGPPSSSSASCTDSNGNPYDCGLMPPTESRTVEEAPGQLPTLRLKCGERGSLRIDVRTNGGTASIKWDLKCDPCVRVRR